MRLQVLRVMKHPFQAAKVTQIASAIGFLVVGTAARADAFAPLMLAVPFHLVVGNGIIGLFEAALLRWRFQARDWTSYLMVPANYVSCFAGFALLRRYHGTEASLGPALLHLLPWLLAGLVVGSYVLSVILEWPFCWLIARGRPGRAWTAWKMSLAAQTASYAILVPLYLLISPVSLYTHGHVRTNASFVRTPLASVYYIDRDGDIARVQTDGRGGRKVKCVGLDPRLCALMLVPPSPGATADLSSLCYADYAPTVQIPAVAPAGTYIRDKQSTSNLHGYSGGMGYGRGDPDFRPAGSREWTVYPASMAMEGLRVSHRGREEYILALQTAVIGLPWKDTTTLPNGQVVAELGGMIVLLDPPSHQLAALAKGRSPVVVLPDRNR